MKDCTVSYVPRARVGCQHTAGCDFQQLVQQLYTPGQLNASSFLSSSKRVWADTCREHWAETSIKRD